MSLRAQIVFAYISVAPVDFSDAGTATILEKTPMELVAGNDVDSRQSRDVFVHRARIMLPQPSGAPEVDEDIIIPPRCLGDQSSGTLGAAWFASLKSVGINLWRLARFFAVIYVVMGIDGAITNSITHQYLNERLPPNVVVIGAYCNLHGSNLVTSDQLAASGCNLLNSLYSMSHLTYVGNYFGALTKAVLDDIDAVGIDWSCATPPSAEDHRRHQAIVRLCLPSLHLVKERCAAVQESLAVLNGKWSDRKCAHFCTQGTDGRPCCNNEAEAIDKVKRAVLILLLAARPEIVTKSRWLSAAVCIGWWSLGSFVHKSFIRAFARAWPTVGRHAKLSQVDLDAANSDSDVDEKDLLEYSELPLLLVHILLILILLMLFPLSCSSFSPCSSSCSFPFASSPALPHPSKRTCAHKY